MTDIGRPQRIGPPLTSDAHWRKFLYVLRLRGIDEPIIAHLEEFRRLGKLLTGLELVLTNSDAAAQALAPYLSGRSVLNDQRHFSTN